jgi:hypothetical protein
MARGTEQLDVRPLSDDERRRMLAMLDRISRRREAMLEARGGRLFPSSGKEIAEMRRECEQESP